GPILLQFPLYGGIMGIMTGTGLAGIIAASFVAFSTQHTLPFWSFVSSNIITLFVPSGGGHWAVQGPFMIPAAVKLHVGAAITAMGTAMGEETANMIQPFWALPILAIARLGIKDIMGYGVEVYPGHPCPHSSGHHCLIYERRPLDPCRRFFCGWLVPASPLPDWLRPDKAKVIFLPAQFNWHGQDVDVAVPVGDGPDDKTTEWLKNFASERRRLLLYRLDQDWFAFGPPAFQA